MMLLKGVKFVFIFIYLFPILGCTQGDYVKCNSSFFQERLLGKLRIFYDGDFAPLLSMYAEEEMFPYFLLKENKIELAYDYESINFIKTVQKEVGIRYIFKIQENYIYFDVMVLLK